MHGSFYSSFKYLDVVLKHVNLIELIVTVTAGNLSYEFPITINVHSLWTLLMRAYRNWNPTNMKIE